MLAFCQLYLCEFVFWEETTTVGGEDCFPEGVFSDLGS